MEICDVHVAGCLCQEKQNFVTQENLKIDLEQRKLLVMEWVLFNFFVFVSTLSWR